MSGVGGAPLLKLMAAIREFQAREEGSFHKKELRALIDALKQELAISIAAANQAKERL